MKNRLQIFMIALTAATSGILFGYDIGIIADALPFLKTAFNLSTRQQEIVVSLVPFGAAIGALFSGRLSDRYGRLKALLFASIMFIFGTVVISTASTITNLYWGRFILGAAVGIVLFCGPLYISEIAPPRIRGRLVALYSLTGAAGILLAYVIGFQLAKTGAWKEMFFVGIFPAVFLLVGCLFLPPSPRWLVKKNRIAHARKVLHKFYHPHEVEKTLKELTEVHAGASTPIGKKTARFLLICGCTFACLQQFSGANAVFYFAPELLRMFKLDTFLDKYFVTILLGAANFVGAIISIFLVDKIGRRPILLGGFSMMVFSLGCLYACPHFFALSREVSIFMAFCLLGYILAFSISLGSLYGLIINEIFPLQMRGKASGMATAFNCGASLIVSFFSLSFAERYSVNTLFLVFGIINVVGFVFCFFFIPETKNMSLEKIQLRFEKTTSDNAAASAAAAEKPLEV